MLVLEWGWEGSEARGPMVTRCALRPGLHLEASVRAQPAEWPLSDGCPHFLILLIPQVTQSLRVPFSNAGVSTLTLGEPGKVATSPHAYVEEGMRHEGGLVTCPSARWDRDKRADAGGGQRGDTQASGWTWSTAPWSREYAGLASCWVELHVQG